MRAKCKKIKLNTYNQKERLLVKKVLVIGASTGFGLASRISSALDLMQQQLVF
jgi:trans-2-enoyl-CoA reductase